MMEGILYVRKRRSKLIYGWNKRYIVLTSDGLWKEYEEAKSSLEPRAGSGMILRHEIDIRGSRIKTIVFPLVGRHFVFRIKRKQSPCVRFTLSAKSQEQLAQWMSALHSSCLVTYSTNIASIERIRSPALYQEQATKALTIGVPHVKTSQHAYVDTQINTKDDVVTLLQSCVWMEQRLRLETEWDMVRRGSICVGVNGLSLHTLTRSEVDVLLQSNQLPFLLRWFQSPSKRGFLHGKICVGLTTQLQTMALLRNGIHPWIEYVVELEHDVLMCQSRSSDGPCSVFPLSGGCVVKRVHELVVEQQSCFLVCVSNYSMLFQAATYRDMIEWTEAIQQAIQLAEGVFPEDDEDDDDEGDEDVVESIVSEEEFEEGDNEVKVVSEHCDSNLTDTQLIDMLSFCQLHGRYVEALNLMASHSERRVVYWSTIFEWAIEPMDEGTMRQLLKQPLDEADAIQVQKDVPRTSQWLISSAGAPDLTTEARHEQLVVLEQVLHAFLTGCATNEGTNSKSFYMQGMNGIAFITLHVLPHDRVMSLQVVRGIISYILPHVFGFSTLNQDSEIFSSLIEAGSVLSDVIQLHLPRFYDTMEKIGLPVSVFAYKWFPTLFSDISILANRSQLQYSTLLAIWDVCLFMGVEGMFLVALTLCSAVETSVLQLSTHSSTELVVSTIMDVLVKISPLDLISSICEVVEVCTHPVLIKLRTSHQRRLRTIMQPLSQGPSPAKVKAAPRRLSNAELKQDTSVMASAVTIITQAMEQAAIESYIDTPADTMMVHDLDSGDMFHISRSTSLLIRKGSVSKNVQ